MDTSVQTLPRPRSIGLRIKAAREAQGWKQEPLSQAMGIADRQTISQIEKGERQIKPAELVKLCELLNCKLDYFTDPFVVAGEAQFSWRAKESLPCHVLDAFEARVGLWVGMLRFLRQWSSSDINPFGASLRLTKHSSFEDAMCMGELVAERLDLGEVPAERLIAKIEQHLDIPVLFVDVDPIVDGDISGAMCHMTDLGVILINRNELLARRNFDLAHELFHALTWEAMKPQHRESNDPDDRHKGKRIESLADNFASGLLMPRASLEKFIDPAKSIDIQHLASVAHHLQVSPRALAWRLFNAKLIDRATCNALRTERQKSDSAKPKRFSETFVNLLDSGIERGYVSSRKVAKALGVTLPELAELFEEHGKQAPFAL